MAFPVINPFLQFFDNAGDVLAGGFVYTYEPGTEDLKTTYQNENLSTPNTNPIELSSAGRCTIFTAEGSECKYVLKTSTGVTLDTKDEVRTPVATQAGIGALLYPITQGETDAVVTPINYWYPPGHVLRYGTNTTPGTTNMTVAFQAAALSSLQPYAPEGVFLITASIPLRDNQHWRLDGTRISITGNTKVFTAAAGIDDWSIAGSWSVTGDNDDAGSVSGTAAGVYIVDSMRWRVEGFTAKNIKGWGILVDPGSNNSNRAERGQILAPQAYGCYVGIECTADRGAEYVNIVAPNITRCATGLIASAGNVVVTGGNVVDNVDGIRINAGANHAHGIITGVNVNHNSQFNLRMHNNMNGHTFNGCHWYQGSIWLDCCKGVAFEGGIIDCGLLNYKDVDSGLNFIRNAYMPSGGTGMKRIAGSNNGHDLLIIENCFGTGAITDATGGVDSISGLTINDVSRMHVYALRSPTVNQSLTSGVAADLLFPTEQFDRRLAYDPSTGIITIPAGQSGNYRLKANCLFGGTAMSATGTFIDVQVNGASKRLCLPSIFSTTVLRVLVDEEIYLTAADAVKLRATVVGTTPVFGNATWESFLSIERVA